MNIEQIYTQLTGIFREVFDDPTITPRPDMTAEDVKDWDSFNHINLIVAIEAHFNIKFKTAELEQLRNVGNLVEVIESKVNAA